MNLPLTASERGLERRLGAVAPWELAGAGAGAGGWRGARAHTKGWE